MVGHSHVQDAPSRHDTDVLLQASKVIAAAIAHSLTNVEDPVSVSGMRVLVMVRSQGALNLSAVADALGVNPSSASRTCDRLVQAGLLDRRDNAEDRRQVSLTLTRGGTRFVDAMLDDRRTILEKVVSSMPPGAQRSLMSGLEAFVAAAASLADRPSPDDDSSHLLRWIV